MRRILEKKKYVYVWSKYSLESKRDSEKRKAFKEKLSEYLKIEKENPELLQVWFWDGAFKVATQVRHTAPHESGFSLRVIRRKNWCKKGKRKKVRGDRRKGRVNVMGALRYSDKKRFVDFLKKSNSKSFYEVLKLFYEELINEWIKAGNKKEYFVKKGPKIVIILDNASFHKKAEYIDKIETEMPNRHLQKLTSNPCTAWVKTEFLEMSNIHLEYLPKYSPDYNLIELVWHSAKEYIANRLFESIEEL
ncbi:hypothetical protein LYNGBM3L_50040 [Moorena producens 3L]|uniref:Tc1-like transposase DDE domain-containing protein n=1 Tax=Moorena producens 3L TaxID=489825 RepID=F4XY45_9CYAN|nr:hypothetical protein LYNGBM3L_50040 [Moorena producens 3L]OLT68658.1 IS630 family transposase [Moorena producens 3L]